MQPNLTELIKRGDEKTKLALQQLAAREAARRRLIPFVTQTLEGYTPGWVHHDVSARLERFSTAVLEKKSPRLLLMMPPRAGKSELASIRLPAWHLGRAPHHEIINAGYNTDLPMIFSRKVRALLRDPYYQSLFPETQLSADSQSVETWATTKNGGFIAAGVGSGLTGKGAHILIIDDPIKNMEEADSADRRELISDWYESTAYTRLAPGGGVLVIQTCWNFDDLAGRLQSKMAANPKADQFEIVRYPAISDEGYEYRNEDTFEIVRSKTPLVAVPKNYTLLREINTALHEERYPTEHVLRQKENMQPRIWEALYQQRPAPEEGMYFRKQDIHTRPMSVLEEDESVFTAWDFAIGTKNSNDFTAGATISYNPDKQMFVRELNHFRGDSLEIVERIIDTAQDWLTRSNRNYSVGVEDGQIWKSIKPLLEIRMRERGVFFPITVLKPLTDKIARARPLQGLMQQKRVWFPEGAVWMPTLLREFLQFPGGAHDDIVDAVSWCVRTALEHGAPSRIQKKTKIKSWKDRLNSTGHRKSMMSS